MKNSEPIEGTAELLLLDLELLDIHDVWENAGSTRYGYVDPNDLAEEMASEVIQPFLDEWKQLETEEEKKTYALELIKGLEMFQTSSSEFKDAAVNTIDETLGLLKQSLSPRN